MPKRTREMVAQIKAERAASRAARVAKIESGPQDTEDEILSWRQNRADTEGVDVSEVSEPPWADHKRARSQAWLNRLNAPAQTPPAASGAARRTAIRNKTRGLEE